MSTATSRCFARSTSEVETLAHVNVVDPVQLVLCAVRCIDRIRCRPSRPVSSHATIGGSLFGVNISL